MAALEAFWPASWVAAPRRAAGRARCRPGSSWRHDGPMDARDAARGPQVRVREVQPGTAGFGQVLTVAGGCWPRTGT